MKMDQLQFHPIPSSRFGLSETITSSRGNRFQVLSTGSTHTMISETDPNNHIIVIGDPGFAELSFSGIGDAIGDAIKAIIQIMTCKPMTTTTVETHKDGTVKVTTTTTCAPT